MSDSTLRILITAGPTHEPIDAVRYIANRSSGRLGIAIARAAAREFATTLLLGPTCAEPPDSTGLRVERFRTTADLQALLEERWPQHNVLIMAAAVADYRPPPKAANEKLRRTDAGLTLQLAPTPDLLAECAARQQPSQRIIGFALEPQHRLKASAADKLARKDVDAIVANPLETMDAEDIEASLLLRSGEALQPPGRLSKVEFAEWLIAQLPRIPSRA